MVKVYYEEKCFSTQDSLKARILSGEKGFFAVTCKEQLRGRGRQGREWHSFKNTLTLSFTYPPNKKHLFLTSCELSLKVWHFFQEKWGKNLQLKWPNDLMMGRGEKAGGILLEYHSEDLLLVGIGLNLCILQEERVQRRKKEEEEKSHYAFAGIFSPEEFYPTISSVYGESYEKPLVKELYSYLLSHTIPPEKITPQWESHCLHLYQEVQVSQLKGKKGIFMGIDEIGQAKISCEGSLLRVNSGEIDLGA